jgi:hypothetical protein
MASSAARPATVADVHDLAMSMPHVSRLDGAKGRPVYQVGGKSFIFFRNPRHLSVLLRERDLADLSYQELAEVVQDAWLSRASARRASDWLKSRGLAGLFAEQFASRLVDLGQRGHQVLAFRVGEAGCDLAFEQPPI